MSVYTLVYRPRPTRLFYQLKKTRSIDYCHTRRGVILSCVSNYIYNP